MKQGLQQLLTDSIHGSPCENIPCIRAVACHHCFATRGGCLDARPWGASSGKDLLHLMRAHQAGVALTGHAHYVLPWKKEAPPDSARPERSRLGTALRFNAAVRPAASADRFLSARSVPECFRRSLVKSVERPIRIPRHFTAAILDEPQAYGS